MDDRRGNFEPITIEKYNDQMQQAEPLVFKVGEILSIRGSRLRVQRIQKNRITMKLLPQLKNS